jgi:COP9 signalosome complex subunit 7
LIKLKLLSLVTLSSQSKILKYDSLLEYLDIPNVRELEDLLINAIYQNIIHGKLDQRNKQVDIEYTMSRDLEAKQIIYIKNILSNWLNTSETVIEKLDQEIARIDKEVSAKITMQEKYDNDITDLIKRYKLEAINDAELKFKNSITKKDKMKQPY